MRARVRYDDAGHAHRDPVVVSARCGKYTYATKKLAKANARAQSRASGETIEAYHCYPCHGYHLGHPPTPYDPGRARGAA